ncbi:MAG TPA: T9SS type A sorting domain-containing protein [Bacteroidia bacterium]
MQRTLNAQVVYPPNHSFEDDTINYGVLPWQTSGYHDLNYSVNMILAAEGKYFFELASFRINNVYTNSKLWIKFPINERARFLNFSSIFDSYFENYKFRVKIMMTKFDPYYKRSYMVCNMDTLMDTICNYRAYRKDWFHNKMDLKPYYLTNETPDSCYIEISCDLNYKGFFDYIQYLYLDNFFLNGNVDAQVSVEGQSISNCDVRVYPNPSNGLLNMDLSAVPDVVKLEVLSADGQTVVFLDDPEELIQLDLSACARGCYLLKIASADGNIQYKKLLLE